MKDVIWSSLISSLQSGQCVLVLGPDIEAEPMDNPNADIENTSLRDVFCQYLAKQLEDENQKIGEMVLFAVAQQFYDSPALSTVNLKNIAAQFFRDARYRPGPQHHQLAQCPFSIVLTTCHDDLFNKALIENNKKPSKYWYHYRGEPRDNKELDGIPDHKNPALYHLFGALDEPNSLVLTENDLLDFVIHVISSRPKLPDSLRSALRNKTFLFFGFGIRHWYLRVLLKLIVHSLEFSGGSVALESLSALNATEKEQTVLFYKRGSRIEVVDMDGHTFTNELLERLERAGGYHGASTRSTRRVQVFISYERSDSDLAKNLYDHLPKEQFDVCLDTQFLEGGDNWNSKLEDQIKSCDYFLILNSNNLKTKQVGYVNKELVLALDQQKYHQSWMTFIIPLLVDGMSANDGNPDLKPFNQLPLRIDTLSSDIELIAKKMSRDFQLRER